MPATIEANSDGRFTSYVIEADSEAEALDAIDAIKANYHPLGYGTHFDEPKLLEESGRWVCRGSRANTCD